ncbi:unnamed protein product, partial [Ectocarpus sp. 4 AP-2014]
PPATRPDTSYTHPPTARLSRWVCPRSSGNGEGGRRNTTDALHHRTSTRGNVRTRLGLDIVKPRHEKGGGRNRLHPAEKMPPHIQPATALSKSTLIRTNTHRPALTFDTTGPPTNQWGPPPLKKQNRDPSPHQTAQNAPHSRGETYDSDPPTLL